MTLTTSRLGPCLSATLVTSNLEMSVSAYCGFLHQHVHSSGVVSASPADRWGLGPLTGMSMAWLANELDEPWLRLIEIPGAETVNPFDHRGWMSLEISVQDVDKLFGELEQSPFKVIGEPANLDVSNDIRAMQVIGPSGEVLYLTEVKAEVPPFELPFARCAVDRLFIPVLLTNDRDRTLAGYERLSGTTGLSFDTKITVINRARGMDILQRHPVATLQLRGKNVIEIDQLDDLSSRPRVNNCLPAGIAVITFAIQSMPDSMSTMPAEEGAYAGCRAALVNGGAGECIELIETDTY